MAHRQQTPSQVAAAEMERRSAVHVPHHPGQALYLGIALILAVITGIEVALYYIDMSETALIILLLALSALKFLMVAGWFMHLRFDSSAFTMFFAGGLALAFIVMTVVLSVQRVFFV